MKSFLLLYAVFLLRAAASAAINFGPTVPVFSPFCDDGQVGSGVGVGLPEVGCISGFIPPIDDGNPDTIETVDEALDLVIHTDTNLSDGDDSFSEPHPTPNYYLDIPGPRNQAANLITGFTFDFDYLSSDYVALFDFEYLARGDDGISDPYSGFRNQAQLNFGENQTISAATLSENGIVGEGVYSVYAMLIDTSLSITSGPIGSFGEITAYAGDMHTFDLVVTAVPEANSFALILSIFSFGFLIIRRRNIHPENI